MKRTIKNAGSDIHLLGNRLSRVFVDKKILNSEEVTEKQVFLRNAFITNNVFNLGENQFAGKDIIFTSNTFAIVESYAALVWADSAIYTGNHSPRKNVLFNISNNIEKAANLLDIKLP